MTDPHNPTTDTSTDTRQALVMVAVSYAFWGFVVGYYKLLAHVPVAEIIAHRAFWSVVVVGGYLVARRGLRELPAILSDRPVLLRLIASAAILYVNWGLFVYAVNDARILDASFAYFINPILSVLLGLALLGECMSRAQWVGVALVLIAILAQGALLGHFPWLSLAIGGTFALYGFVKKETPVRAAPGMLIETALSLVVAVPYILSVEASGTGHALTGVSTFGLLVMAGPITVVPLILYAAAAQKLPLVTIGLMQYIVPTLHFLMAVLVFGEPLSLAKLATFVLAWIGLAVVTVDALTRERGPRHR
jgi:chloramphenicol-sensitive protein RarD